MKRALTSLEELKSDKCPNKSKRLRLINEAAEEFGRAIHKAKEDLEGMKMKLSQTQKATKHLKQILQTIFAHECGCFDSALCLRAKGNVLIVVDKEKWCESSDVIQTAISSQIGPGSVDGTSIFSMESDSPELLRIIALLMDLGEDDKELVKLPPMPCMKIYDLMEISTRLNICWICKFLSLQVNKKTDFSGESGLTFLRKTHDQKTSCDEDFKPHWERVFMIAKEHVPQSILSSLERPYRFSQIISIALLDEMVSSTKEEEMPKPTRMELPETSSTNGFMLSIKPCDGVISAELSISPDNRRAIRLSGEETYGIFDFDIYLGSTSAETSDSDDLPIKMQRRQVSDSFRSAGQAQAESRVRCKALRQLHLPAETQTDELDITFRAHMDRLHMQVRLLLWYAWDALRPDGEEQGCESHKDVSLIDALLFFHNMAEQKREESGSAEEWEATLLDEMKCLERLSGLLGKYAAAGFSRIYNKSCFAALPAAVINDVILRDELWTDRSEEKVLHAVMQWGRNARNSEGNEHLTRLWPSLPADKAAELLEYKKRTFNSNPPIMTKLEVRAFPL